LCLALSAGSLSADPWVEWWNDAARSKHEPRIPSKCCLYEMYEHRWGVLAI
jgi:hypothetical protein